MIDQYARQLLADGFVYECRDNGRVYTAGKAQQYVAVADLLAYALYLVFDDLGGGPELCGFTDIQHEVLENPLALKGVGHFRVELQSVETAFLVGHARHGNAAQHDALPAAWQRQPNWPLAPAAFMPSPMGSTHDPPWRVSGLRGPPSAPLL